MKQKETFYTSDRKIWRNWLAKNFETKEEIWFIFPSAVSNEKSLSYNDAVEEALCYGWIDSTAGHIDKTHSIRRFSPRKDYSYFSRINIERLIWLDKNNMIHPKVKELTKDIINEKFVFPKDIIEVLKKDKIVWKNYKSFSDSYKRIRIAYIDDARNKPKEFEKRLNNFIDKTRENKKIVGFGGMSKYYM